MLIVTKRVGEKLVFGKVTVTILQAKGSETRLLIKAPKSIAVQREEASREFQCAKCGRPKSQDLAAQIDEFLLQLAEQLAQLGEAENVPYERVEMLVKSFADVLQDYTAAVRSTMTETKGIAELPFTANTPETGGISDTPGG